MYFMFTPTTTNTLHITELSLAQICFVAELNFINSSLTSPIQFSSWLVDIHVFNYPDSRLSRPFSSVPTSLDTQGLTVQTSTANFLT